MRFGTLIAIAALLLLFTFSFSAQSKGSSGKKSTSSKYTKKKQHNYLPFHYKKKRKKRHTFVPPKRQRIYTASFVPVVWTGPEEYPVRMHNGRRVHQPHDFHVIKVPWDNSFGMISRNFTVKCGPDGGNFRVIVRAARVNEPSDHPTKNYQEPHNGPADVHIWTPNQTELTYNQTNRTATGEIRFYTQNDDVVWISLTATIVSSTGETTVVGSSLVKLITVH